MRHIFNASDFTIENGLVLENEKIGLKKAYNQFKFNNSLVDSVGSGVATPSGSEHYITGRLNEAYNFRGEPYNDSVSINGAIPTGTHTPFTFAFWAYIYDDDGNGNLTSTHWLFTRNKLQTFFYNGNQLYAYLSGDSGVSVGKRVSGIPIKSWCHLAITYDGSGTAEGLKFYINGVETAASTTHNVLDTNPQVYTSAMNISQNSNSLHAYIDDLKMFDTAISAGFVSSIYNGGAGNEDLKAEAGLYKATATNQFEVSFLDEWSEFDAELEGDVSFTIKSGAKEFYIDANGTVKETDGTDRNTKAELIDRINNWTARQIQPVAYLNYTGSGDLPTFTNATLNYLLETSKVVDIAIDASESQKMKIYEDEKKYVKFSYTKNDGITPLDLTGATISMKVAKELGGEAVCSKTTEDFGLSDLANGNFYCNLDGAQFEAGVYYSQLNVSFGDDYSDYSRVFRLVVLQRV